MGSVLYPIVCAFLPGPQNLYDFPLNQKNEPKQKDFATGFGGI
jgi:hypothetical protein